VTAMLCVVDRLISRHSIESSSGMFLFCIVSTPNNLSVCLTLIVHNRIICWDSTEMNWSKTHYFPVDYCNYQRLTIEGEGRRAFQFTFVAMPLAVCTTCRSDIDKLHVC